VISGTIREVLVVGHYSYLRVERGPRQGDAWVVVMNEAHAPGEVVTARAYASLASFRSERLGRVFDKVYFGAVGGPARWTR
jgi:hypothetical protein